MEGYKEPWTLETSGLLWWEDFNLDDLVGANSTLLLSSTLNKFMWGFPEMGATPKIDG